VSQPVPRRPTVYFIKAGTTLTGFDWVFYLYGPWAADFDKALEQLQAEQVIDVGDWADGFLEGKEIRHHRSLRHWESDQ